MQRKGSPSVLIVSHDFGYDGDLMYYGEIFAALRERVPDLAIAVDERSDFANPHHLDLRPLFRRHSLPLSNGSGYGRALHVAPPTLAVRVAKLRPEVLVALEFTPVSLLAMLGSLASRKTKRVLLVEGDPALRGASASSIALVVKRKAVALADVIVTNNEAGARYLIDRLGAERNKVRVTPYLTSRPPGPPARLDLPQGPVRLLFANTLSERKNAQVVIEAMALLEPEIRKKLDLTIVGDGPCRPTLERQVEKSGLARAVSFVGAKSYAEIGRYYADADVLLCPSKLDYRSLASFEGLAYGLALLVSRADGGARETVVEGETGFTFAPDDAAELAGHLAALAQDRNLLASMRDNALALYRDRYSVEAAAANLAAAIAAAGAN